MHKIQEKLRPFAYIITSLIVIVPWINLMCFVSDGDVLALLLTPILFLGVVYLVGGLVQWWKLKNLNITEFEISQSQKRFANFYPFFLFLAAVIVAGNIFSILTMGFKEQLFWNGFVACIF